MVSYSISSPRARTLTSWTRAALFVLPLVAASCAADPTAIQKFAQSAPPQAQFNALLLDYPGILMQEPRIDAILRERSVQTPIPPETVTFCSHIQALELMHKAMVTYMNGLQAAATAGTAMAKTASGGAPSVGAESDGSAAVPGGSAQPPGQLKGPACPPVTMPVLAAAAQPAASTAAGSTASAGSSSATLTSGLQSFAKAFPQFHISQNTAGAAGSLIQLIVDTATTLAREEAVRRTLQSGHDAFLSAIEIETTVLQQVAERAGTYAKITETDLSSLALTAALQNPQGQRVGQSVAVQLLVASYFGQLMRPQDARDIQAAAQAFVTALTSLQTAYVKIYDTSVSGHDVLTAGTLAAIQPLLTDVFNAYAALSKL